MPRLKDILDRLYTEFDVSFLETDPLLFLHRYENDADKEVIGFLSALFAYGSVALIVRNLEGLFEKLGQEPAEFLKNADIPALIGNHFQGWKYRFHKEDDLKSLLLVIQATLLEYGSLQNAFLAQSTKNKASEKDFKDTMNRFIETLWRRVPQPTRGMKFFLPSPKGKGTCKRFNLFLRWMVRKDSIDSGIWKDISPSQLYFPVDTHIHQITRDLRITKSKNPTWKTVEEITAYFRKLDPLDPVKYDFALTRLGMLRECPLKGEAITCKGCPLKPYCSKRGIGCQ